MGKSWKQKKSQKSPWGPAAGIGSAAQTVVTSILPTAEGQWPDRKGGGKLGGKNDQDLGKAPKSGYPKK